MCLILWLWLVLLPLGIAAMIHRYYRLASLTGSYGDLLEIDLSIFTWYTTQVVHLPHEREY